jgi:FAD/FMN-containing dehydrogenase
MAVIDQPPRLAGFAGTLMAPDHPDYDAARAVFNAMFDRRPALIARCADADDVVLAVNAARRDSLPVSVYGGGHAVTGLAVCEGGICIDMRGMNRISLDPATRTCRAEAGLTWGEFDAATAVHGLAVTGGRNPSTGIAGLALGSGSGWLERKIGYVCDNLERVEMVTADGRKVAASADENPDLFWGVRGGGGNFGVVTAFHFRLTPLPATLLGGILVYPPQQAAAVIRNFRDVRADAPDEIGAAISLTSAPDLPVFPPALRNGPVVLVHLLYAGPYDEGERRMAPLRGFGPPAADLVGPTSYAAFQAAGPGEKGLRNYWTADFYGALPDEAIEVLAKAALDPVSPSSNNFIAPGGGAASRVPEETTAFGERRAAFNIHYLSSWSDATNDARNIARTKALSEAMKPWATGRVYLNYIGNEGQARIDSSFGPAKLARLRTLKAKWDPDNLFRHNQNIAPAEADV